MNETRVVFISRGAGGNAALFTFFPFHTSTFPFSLSRLFLSPIFPFPFTFQSLNTMPPKKAAATAKKTAAKPAGPKIAGKNTKPAATGRGRPKKMSTETTTKTAVKKEPAEESRKTKTATKTATKSKTTTATTTTTTTASKKRKADVVEEKPREQKKARVTQARAPKAKVVINEAPKTRLNVFVCGEGSSGELGLGTAKNVIDVKRPRLNQLLAADKVGVVQIAVGGMHCVALTHDNKIFTWGVNDQGALGRDTAWEGGYKDIDDNSDSDSDDDDSGLNPREATPTAIPVSAFPEGTVFVEVAAADSSSFALTDDGLVYGWGTFRVRSNHHLVGGNFSANYCSRATTASWDSTPRIGSRLPRFSSHP